MKREPFKTGVAIVVGIYFLWCAFDPAQWRFIDGINLVIHEAGHMLFMPFGEFLMIAGGSLWQVNMPAAFVWYFRRQAQPYSAALALFWVGQSMLNVSVYAGDAVVMQLPLLGGQDSLHDWNYLLERMGWLDSTAAIAGMMRFAATLIILGATGWAVQSARLPSGE